VAQTLIPTKRRGVDTEEEEKTEDEEWQRAYAELNTEDDGWRQTYAGIHGGPTFARTAGSAGNPFSPAPEGFVLNRGPNAIPFRITTMNGREIEAKYIQLYMTNDPYAQGKMTRDGAVHVGRVYAKADLDCSKKPNYGEKLRYFREEYTIREEIDDAIARLRDRSLEAEVHRFRATERRIQTCNDEIQRLEDRMFDLTMMRSGCVRRLELANAIERIEGELGPDIQPTTPWTASRDIDHVDSQTLAAVEQWAAERGRSS
jgi:hypothetical protein